MSPELASLWQELLKRVASDIPGPSFDTWVRPAQPIACYEDLIIVGAPNDLAKERLESTYLPVLRSALRAVVGRDMRLSVVLPPSGVAAERPSAPAAGSGEAAFTPLNPKYTFQTFVVGNSNRFAHAATLAVAETPAGAYNPLFVYGGVGLGKTHLMHAIGHYVLHHKPAARVCYVSSETFTNEFINSLRDNKTVEFQNRYRRVDILLIDDIQFLQGKERTQEEFYHTFNAIHEANKQIVISSDRPPKEIPTLEERLRSRFEWGLICDIQPPDLETRIAILRKKSTFEGLPVDDDTLAYIATRVETNIRELEGALNRVVAFANIHNLPVSPETAAEVLKNLLPPPRQQTVTVEEVMRVVAEHFSLQVEDFRARKRTRAIAHPRQVAMYLARDLTGLSLPRIGEEFGGRDHTTVLHACEKIAADAAVDTALQATLRELRTRLGGD